MNNGATQASAKQNGAQRWFRPRFSLRVLLAAATLLGVCLGLWLYPAVRQRAAVAELRKLDTCVVYYDYDPPGPWPEVARMLDPSAPSSSPGWLAERLGHDFFHGASTVILDRSEAEAALPHLRRLPSLREIYLFDNEMDDAHQTSDERVEAMNARLRKELPGVKVEPYHWHGLEFSTIPVVG